MDCKVLAQDHLASNKNMPVSKNDSYEEIVAKLGSLAIIS